MKKSVAKLILIGLLVSGYLQAQAADIAFLESYNSSNNYKSLVDEALKAPERGGYFYASKIVGQCSLVRDLQDRWKDSEVSKLSARSEAISVLVSRCGSLGDANSRAAVAKDLKASIADKDPLYVAATSYTKSRNLRKNATTQERKTEAVTSVARLKDPLLVDDLGLRLIASRDNTTTATTFKINGRTILLNDRLDAGLAMYLVPCEMGLKCDEKEFSIALSCASSGECHAGRHDKVKKMTEGAGTDYGAIERAAKEIARSLSDQTQGSILLN